MDALEFMLLWSRRALVKAELCCSVSVQRLFVLLVAYHRSRIGPEDVQACAQEFEVGPHHQVLERLACGKAAYGLLYRLYGSGLLVRSSTPGYYTLVSRARVTLERVLAREPISTFDPRMIEDPDVSYSVHVDELPGMPFPPKRPRQNRFRQPRWSRPGAYQPGR